MDILDKINLSEALEVFKGLIAFLEPYAPNIVKGLLIGVALYFVWPKVWPGVVAILRVIFKR